MFLIKRCCFSTMGRYLMAISSVVVDPMVMKLVTIDLEEVTMVVMSDLKAVALFGSEIVEEPIAQAIYSKY
jgi:hypothetical protein